MNLQRRKNLLMLGILVTFAVIVFGVTIVKVQDHGPKAIPAIAEQKTYQ